MESVLKVSHQTLIRRFGQAIKEGREDRNCSLRRKQYEQAMNGNVTMLIWLGKQFLGQSDKRELSGDMNFKHEFDTSKLTDEQLAQIENLVESAQPGTS